MSFKFRRSVAGSIAACLLAVSGWLVPAAAEMTDAEMRISFGQAELFGRVLAEAEACGSDMSAITGLYDRAWTCQGATANQLIRIKAELAGAKARSKTTVCAVDKAAQDKKIADAAQRLAGELKELTCKP